MRINILLPFLSLLGCKPIRVCAIAFVSLFVFSILSSANAAEKHLLVCDGVELSVFDPPSIQGLGHQITLAISEEYVESSESGLVQLDDRSSHVLVWRAKWGELHALFNLNIISGLLEKFVSREPMEDGTQLISKLTYTCRRVAQTLLQ